MKTTVQIKYKGIPLTVTGYYDGGEFEVEDVTYTDTENTDLSLILHEVTEAHPMNEIATLAAEAQEEYYRELGEDDRYEETYFNRQ